jgi:PspAB-like protein
MGFLDALLGKRKLKAPAPDRLFALTTAYVDLETSQGITTRGTAAIVFQPLATGDFQQIVTDMQEVVSGVGGETGTTLETRDDDFGYRWMILRDPDLEDLAVGVNAVSDALAVGGYQDRVLCAVFAFEDAQKHPIYFIYNYKRGAWYPFVPAGGAQQRDSERELRVKAQVAGSALPVEPDLERWFPLWGIPI